MELNEYQELAMRTNGTTGLLPMLSNAALGLCGESGEVADTIKKVLHAGHPLDSAAVLHIAKELGDTFWYIAQAATALDLTLENIAQVNIAKLRKRYPEGFSSERSINRDMSDSLTVDGQDETGIGQRA